MRQWLIGFALTVALAGCGRRTEEPAEGPFVEPQPPAQASGLTFAMLPKQLDNPVFSYARQAAEKRAAELGVKLLWDAPATNDEAKQADIFETFVAQGVDGIAVSCINPEIMGRSIDKAVEAGIPVVTWDSDAPNSKRQAFYGLDDYATGKVLATELVALLPEGGKVIILSGVQGAQNLEDRVRGAREVLEKESRLTLLDTVYCQDDIHKAAQLVSDVMTAHPDLAGWCMIGGWPLFSSDGLKAITPGKTKVVAVDPLPEAQHWLAEGYVQVCAGQKVFGWGTESLNLLLALARGETIPNLGENGFVNSGVDLVVPEKSGFYTDQRYIALADYKVLFEQAGGAPGS